MPRPGVPILIILALLLAQNANAERAGGASLLAVDVLGRIVPAGSAISLSKRRSVFVAS